MTDPTPDWRRIATLTFTPAMVQLWEAQEQTRMVT